ncbi:MAG TPA: 4Fe-4S ferredoxin N-terminal domain-containing protein [Dehalococcoidia bacterium]|nr:4Fe-4S ferredoxin N-terminal domain-containing protein [Dehalococcoidia bacterium]
MNRDESSGPPADIVDEVFDAAWEAEARRTVAEVGFDPGLAVRVARDALRVARGDLSPAQFHETYHAAYMRAFGMDLRPSGEEDASQPETSQDLVEFRITVPESPAGADLPGDDDGTPALVSRRTAVKAAGAGAAALLLAQMAGAWLPGAAADGGAHGGHQAAPPPADQSTKASGKRQMGMVIDLEKCDGCLFCVNACRQAYSLTDGVHWIYVFAYKEPDSPDVHLLPRLCNHCSNAPCVKVCPTTARHRRSDGLVLTDYDVCIGCRYCQVACPYGVNYFQWGDPKKNGGGYTGERRDARGRSVVGDPPRGVMGKCTFCPLRQDSHHEQGTTNCALACPHDVLHYGDLNDPQSEPNLYLERRRQELGGRLRTFRLLEDLGTKPNVIYIGAPPSKKAKEVPGPVAYEDWGLVHRRRDALEGPEPWFRRLAGGK